MILNVKEIGNPSELIREYMRGLPLRHSRSVELVRMWRLGLWNFTAEEEQALSRLAARVERTENE